MQFACLLIITGAFFADACVPFGGGGASCGAPPCPPPAPSCGVGGGCIPPAAPPASACGFGGVGGFGCSPPQAPPVPNCAFGGVGCNPPPAFQAPQAPPPPPAPASLSCGLGGCSQPAAPVIVSCGPTGCSPPVAPAAPNCGPSGCGANSNCGSTGCASSSDNGNNEGVQYEYYEENESDSDSGEVSKSPAPKHTEAPAVTEAEYEETDAPAPAKTEAPAEEEPEEETEEETATDAPAEKTEAPAYTDPPSEAKSSVAPEAEVAKPDDVPCQFLTCNFEEGSLCLYQSRGVEHTSTSNAYSRGRRSAVMDFERPKPWVAWMGKFGNRVTGIIEAQQGSTFAASYLKSGQTSILETDILFVNGLTIKFEAYEATEDIALRMCCDSVKNCQWETSAEAGAKSRSWRQVESTCPSGTKKVLFVCQNSGQYQGACGLDNIKVVGSECSQVAGRKTQQRLEPFAHAS